MERQEFNLRSYKVVMFDSGLIKDNYGSASQDHKLIRLTD
jgi:hypothetical protein